MLHGKSSRKAFRFLTLAAWLAVAAGLTACLPHKKAAEQPILALLSDYGMTDAFVAEMKGAILTINPQAHLVDLTHEVEPFDIMEGAYLLNQSSREFPRGTVFVAVVDPQVGTAREPILVQTEAGKFYVAPDNGLLTQVIEREGFSKAWKLDKPAYFRQGTQSFTDHGRDIFGPVGAHLAAGVAPDEIGTSITKKDIVLLPSHPPVSSGPNLSGEIWHVDRYGNIITNIPASIAPDLKEGVLMRVTLGKEPFSAPLVKTYGDVQKGRVALLIGSQGLIEICVNQGSAAKMLNVQVGQPVSIQRP